MSVRMYVFDLILRMFSDKFRLKGFFISFFFGLVNYAEP